MSKPAPHLPPKQIGWRAIKRKSPDPVVVREHFRNVALYPEKYSNPPKGGVYPKHSYEARTHWWRVRLRKLPPRVLRVLDPDLFTFLRATKRNALVYVQDGHVAAHVQYQRHGSELHMYHVWVNELHRKKGFATAALREYLDYARKMPGIKSVRIGGGGDEIVNRIYDHFCAEARELGVVPRPNPKNLKNQSYFLDFV